jgi:hypothetical protein
VTVPVNVTATVMLPAGAARGWGDGQPQLVESHTDRTVFTVGSDHSHFRAVAATRP